MKKKETGAPPTEDVGKIVAAEGADTVSGDGSSEALAPLEAQSTEVPDAPGDEPDAVFARRLDRLTNIVADADFADGTVRGDLIELVLDLFKHRPKLWSAMNESEKKDLVRGVEISAADIIRKVVQAVATVESHFVYATVIKDFGVKGETIECKFKVNQADKDTLIDVYDLAGAEVVIISANDKRFAGRKRDLASEIPPDQIAMAFADDKPKAPGVITTPTPDTVDTNANGNDEDLAGGGEEGPWVVFDPSDKVYLTTDAQGDAWSDDISVATQFATRGAAESKAEAEQAEVQPFKAAEPPAEAE